MAAGAIPLGLGELDLSQRSPLTILTDPMPVGQYLVPELLRGVARLTRNQIRPSRHSLPYRGHPAVTRSLVEGLRGTGLRFNCNPRSIAELHDTVLVLAGARTLTQAIDLKRSGRFTHLFAGPNIVTLPTDHGGLLGAPEIEQVITPSSWVSELYSALCPALTGHLIEWPAGVDADAWRPRDTRPGPAALIYTKGEAAGQPLVEQCSRFLEAQGLETIRIHYGQYTPASYLEALQNAAIMVAFADSESQGIAWAEAWSADVPTLILRQDEREFGGRLHECSSAPYLTESCGAFFAEMESFTQVFETWRANTGQFQPRQWVLDNMTDRICAMTLMNAIESHR